MAKTTKETKAVITEVVEKLKKSIERENSYLKEVEDDKAALTHVQGLQEKGESLPPDSAYSSFTEWIETIQKEIKTGEASIKRIDTEKSEIVAFEYYLANAPEENKSYNSDNKNFFLCLKRFFPTIPRGFCKKHGFLLSPV